VGLVTLLCGVSTVGNSQKYVVEKGEISFTSDAQLELIKALTNKVQGLVDPSNNQFAFLINVNTFRGFNSELQRQHFNDNYLESDRYPKAFFSGKIIEHVDFTRDSTYEVRAKGDLEIHGQKQSRIIRSKLTIRGGKLVIESHFNIPLTDHTITIPKVVNQKIATEIEVVFKASMVQQK
jgi:YceI-like domain